MKTKIQEAGVETRKEKRAKKNNKKPKRAERGKEGRDSNEADPSLAVCCCGAMTS